MLGKMKILLNLLNSSDNRYKYLPKKEMLCTFFCEHMKTGNVVYLSSHFRHSYRLWFGINLLLCSYFQILNLACNKSEIENRVHAIIDKFAERGLRSLAVARQVNYLRLLTPSESSL